MGPYDAQVFDRPPGHGVIEEEDGIPERLLRRFEPDHPPGDPVEIRIRLDRRDRTPEAPTDLQEALAEEGAAAAWEALAPSRRKELLVWLNDAKREQTQAARIGRIVQSALEEGTPRLGSTDATP